MGIFKRITDIISANLNEMTESFEDPEVMLKQAIREMEQSIADASTDTVKVLANEKMLIKELQNNEQQASDWQRRAEQAVSAGDDQLARKALSRRQEHQKLVVALQDQLNLAKGSSQALRHQLEGMQAKLSEAKRSLATLSARKKAADFKKKINSDAAIVEPGSAEDSAFAKFDRLREKVERAEAEADAWEELNSANHSEPTEAFVRPEPVCSQVDDELVALKKKLAK